MNRTDENIGHGMPLEVHGHHDKTASAREVGERTPTLMLS